MAWTEVLPSGKYRALYRDPNGKRRSAGTFDHKRRALNAASAAEQESRSRGWQDPDAADRPWGEWATEWWETRKVEPTTMASETYLLESYLMPKWGTVPLAEITRHRGRAWVTELSKTERRISAAEEAKRKKALAEDPTAKIQRHYLAASSVQRIAGLFSASLNAAVDAEVLPANPVFRLKLPSRPPAGERFLTHAEFASLTEEFWDAFDVAAIALMAGCGLRWGEAMGLHRHRMDRERGWLRVVETWDPKANQIKAYPKGKKARDVPVPGWVGDILDRLPILPAADCGHVHAAGRCRSNLVLHGAGDMTDVNNWRKRVWAPALGRAKIGHARPHDLRHTYASWLVQNGVSIEEVARLLGHASSVVTQRYAHLADTPKDSVLTALGDPFRGAIVGQSDTPGDSQSVRAVPA
ncbi:tyrosine-type recombinase/integrase [Arthrobacter sp. Soil762]|uniref:tyrosine-type recombinase/integrase n=1 Tax=Arthrobacter sp. Soil762 TaxID=1736401 RepID=UPI0006FD4B6B|nr:site-specific integrase [Arthrobacter sp. Soil762]KRE72620.1 hypothetical protein ASG77_08080 [Arthrobacter sp. Soil762]